MMPIGKVGLTYKNKTLPFVGLENAYMGELFLSYKAFISVDCL